VVETANPAHGLCIWLTGLSGAGKSTTARALEVELTRLGRRVVVIDGDAMRAQNAGRLGWTRSDRDENVRRAADLARQAVDEGQVAVCALISPYRAARRDAAAIVGRQRFIEVFVATPLDVCEARDPKGLYAAARRGEIEHFTGISDPYEAPTLPDVVIATTGRSVAENVRTVLERAALLMPC
jgi:adenylyl-sulfate kinase